ncbi:MAG: ATP-binding protein [Candidatus Aminicenantes bacterium]|nr:ATP-binding protein [Candidatus Aminicenantes bacterium]
MFTNLKTKESTAIINSLLAGVVPRTGIQHIAVGRTKEIEAALKCLQDVQAGHSMVKFWIGDFGSGKSFMLRLLDILALKQKFVTAAADFTPEKRLYANDRKAVSLYSSLMDNLSIYTKPNGGALTTLLEKWIEQVIMETARAGDIPFEAVRSEQNAPLIKENIIKTINKITDINAFDFGMVILKYYEGYMTQKEDLCKNALKWLKGEYTTRTEARRDLDVRTIIDDQNYYEMLKNFATFFTYIGYSGFMINLDEAINLYKVTHSSTRDKNYEKILSIYNDCYQGKIANLFFNIAGTNEFLEDRRRGLNSFDALRTRLEGSKFETAEVRDLSQPVIKLLPLTHDEIFVLLQKLKAVFDFHYEKKSHIDDNDIHSFMEIIFNKPGAEEFLTPRDVIKEFLSILSILRQNPHLDKEKLFRTNSLEIMQELGLELGVEEF